MKYKRIIAIVAGILFLITGCGTEGKNNEKNLDGKQTEKEETKESIDGFNTEGTM